MEQEYVKILEDFARKLAESMVDIPPEMTEIVNDHFWELI